jgi:hypothetical protein
MTNLKSLADSVTEPDVLRALVPLSDTIEKAENRIIELLGPNKHAILKSIVKLPSQSFFEVLRSYFLVPAKRLLMLYEDGLYLNIQKYYKLSENHVSSLKQTIKMHVDYLYPAVLFDKDTGKPSQKMKKARLKLKQFVEKLSELLKQTSEFRLSRIQYDKKIPIKNIEKFMNEIMNHPSLHI